MPCPDAQATSAYMLFLLNAKGVPSVSKWIQTE
jgi:hypothetical protein